MPILIVQRDKGWADKIRKYRIFVDANEIGQIGEGEILRHEISVGPHVVEAKIDWCGSQPLKLEARSHDSTVTVKNAMRGWRVVLGLFYVLFKRQDYLKLELTTG